jgi:hypothetical protein
MILIFFILEAPVNDAARKRNGSLPGMGGVYNTINAHLYHYAGNNPVKYTDPDGRTDVDEMLAGKEQIDQGLLEQAIGFAAITGTIVEDVLSGGVGIVDDAMTIVVATEMINEGKNIAESGFKKLADGAAKGNTLNSYNNDASRVKSIFDTLPDGRNRGVKTVGSELELKGLFNKLADGGDANLGGYKGVGAILSDGTSINYRTASRSGGATIDIKFQNDKNRYRIHINEK